MSKCIFCFSHLPEDVVTFVCTNFRCNPEGRTPDRVLSLHMGREAKVGQTFTATKPADQKRWKDRPDSMGCSLCSERMARSCPTCHHVIPDDSLTSDIITVGFTGARNSGKSVAIGSMSFFLESLVEQLRSAMNIDQSTSDSPLEDYVHRLLGGSAPPPTAAGDGRSLVFDLGSIHGKQRYLSLRDVAGEDLKTAVPANANLGFLGRADLVVFLFDPMAIESVQHHLADLIPTQAAEVDESPQTVLTNVLNHMGSGSPQLAVAVSKVDALQALAARPGEVGEIFRQAGAAVNREWPLRPEYHEADGALLHEEVRAILQQLGGGTIVNMVENPASQRKLNHRFFAISALGGSTDANDLDDHGIRPFRILDPILWIFAQRGIVAKA